MINHLKTKNAIITIIILVIVTIVILTLNYNNSLNDLKNEIKALQTGPKLTDKPSENIFQISNPEKTIIPTSITSVTSTQTNYISIPNKTNNLCSSERIDFLKGKYERDKEYYNYVVKTFTDSYNSCLNEGEKLKIDIINRCKNTVLVTPDISITVVPTPSCESQGQTSYQKQYDFCWSEISPYAPRQSIKIESARSEMNNSLSDYNKCLF